MRLKTKVIFIAIFIVSSFTCASAFEIPNNDNPIINYSINPNVTYKYNPNVTYSINPNVTYSINPRVTYKYNPNVTYSINPNVTYSINPAVSECSGLYIYNTSGEIIGLSVTANPEVMLYFLGSEWSGYFVTNKHEGYNLFDNDGDWFGYLIPTPSGGFNLHNLDGDWMANLSVPNENTQGSERLEKDPKLVPRDNQNKYPVIGSGHWIKKNIDSGSLITLEDGSLWKIDPINKIDAMLWLPVSSITVKESSKGSPGYDYLLINTDDGEKAHAKYMGKR